MVVIVFYPESMIMVFGLSCVVAGMIAALSSDWMLAKLAGNWIGIPSSVNLWFSIIYFVAKRLPMF